MIDELYYEKLVPIRHKVLRPNFKIKDCIYPGDTEGSTFHLGYWDDSGELASIASFYKESHEVLGGGLCYRLRGMATLEQYRGNGFATEILNNAMDRLTKMGVEQIWCNARTSAVGFYQKFGFEKKTDEFDISGIGPHYVMATKLKVGPQG